MKTKSDKHVTIVAPLESLNGTAYESSCPSHDEIARLAYSYWEARSGQDGTPEEDWLKAEREILHYRTPVEAQKIGRSAPRQQRSTRKGM